MLACHARERGFDPRHFRKMPRLKKFKIDPSKSWEELYLERRDTAEEVCHTLLLMMGLGLLEIPMENRDMLADVMEVWSDLHFYMKDIER